MAEADQRRAAPRRDDPGARPERDTPGGRLADARRRLVVAFAALIGLLLVIVAVGARPSRGASTTAPPTKYVDDAIPLKTAVQDLVLQTVHPARARCAGTCITGRAGVPRATTARRPPRPPPASTEIEGRLDGHPVLARPDRARRGSDRRDSTVFYEAEIAAQDASPGTLAQTRAQVIEGDRALRRASGAIAELMDADTDDFVREARAAQDRRTDALTVVLLLLGAAPSRSAVALLVAAPAPRRPACSATSRTSAPSRRAPPPGRRASSASPPPSRRPSTRRRCSTPCRARCAMRPASTRSSSAGPTPAGDTIERAHAGRRPAAPTATAGCRSAPTLPIPTVARTARADVLPRGRRRRRGLPGHRADGGSRAPASSWAVLPMRAGGSARGRAGAALRRSPAPSRPASAPSC